MSITVDQFVAVLRTHRNACEHCGGDLIGDGFTSVIHCENTAESTYEFHEADANPVLCTAHLDEPDDGYDYDRYY